MLGTVINAAAILVGGLIGIFFGKRIPTRVTDTMIAGMCLCVMAIAIRSTMETKNIIHAIVCIVLGTLIGEGLRIEERIDSIGGILRDRFAKGEGGSRFTEGFLTTTLLYCIGSMAIIGSLKAGIEGDLSILLSKSLLDGVANIGFAVALGPGVLFSALMVFLYQGTLTLLASVAAPFLGESIVAEMTAVGGVLLIGVQFNVLKLGKHIRLANMLPALFLPIVYFPALDFAVNFLRGVGILH